MTLAGAGEGGGVKWSKGDLALSIPTSALIFLSNSREDCKQYSCVRLVRWSGETNYRAPRTLKKKSRVFWEKKRKKGKEKKKKERPFALTESYFFCIAIENLKRNSPPPHVASGAVPCKIMSNLILGEIVVSNLTNVHKLNTRIDYARLH